jgi:hypothetical protein
MTHGVTLISSLRSTTPAHWTEAASWLGFRILGGLVPIWGQIILLTLFSRPFSIFDLLNHGEFVLYSSAFIAPSLYIVIKDFREIKFVRRQLFVLLAGFALFVSALVYAGLVTVTSFSDQLEALRHVVNEKFLLWVSLAILPLSVIYAYLVTVLDNQRSDPNIRAEVEDKQKQLEKKFDELGGKHE